MGGSLEILLPPLPFPPPLPLLPPTLLPLPPLPPSLPPPPPFPLLFDGGSSVLLLLLLNSVSCGMSDFRLFVEIFQFPFDFFIDLCVSQENVV